MAKSTKKTKRKGGGVDTPFTDAFKGPFGGK